MKLVLSCLIFLAATYTHAIEKDPNLVIDAAKVAHPKNNPSTPEKVELGKKLFFDPRLSSLGIISCNSCHNVMSDGGDGLATSFGVHGKRGGRNAPTVWNSAFLSVQFWDGRAPSLEEQAKGPIINSVEMGMKDHGVAIGRIKDIPGYKADFKKVFGSEKNINIETISQAIAAYERTLITPNSAFDRFNKGDDKALSAEAKKDTKLFNKSGVWLVIRELISMDQLYQWGQDSIRSFQLLLSLTCRKNIRSKTIWVVSQLQKMKTISTCFACRA